VLCTDCDCVFCEVQTEVLYLIWMNVSLHRPSEWPFWKRFLLQNYVRISFFCRPINTSACCTPPPPPAAFATVQLYNYCTSCYLAQFIVAYCQLQSLHRSYCIVVALYVMVQVHRQ
jgi:hypothetical protein